MREKLQRWVGVGISSVTFMIIGNKNTCPHVPYEPYKSTRHNILFFHKIFKGTMWQLSGKGGLSSTSRKIDLAEHTQFWSSRCLRVIGQQLGSLQKTLGDNLALPCSDMIITHSYPAVILLIGWQSSTKEPEFISNGEALWQSKATYKKGNSD